jgi:selenocysteine-specific translation elongation factor
MKHIHIAALEPDAEFAKRIGKKGSESDYCIYNCKEGNSVVCIYHATKYPERVQPLLYCLALADAAYLHPTGIDKQLAEMIVAAATFGKRLLVIADRVSKEEIEPLLKMAGVKEYEFFEGDANALREKLLTYPSTRKTEGKTEVIIDSCFPVKGIGTVALGIVQQGTVKVHQKLTFILSGKESEVKSIQVQDEDEKEAEASSRVGLSLRNVEPSDVEKGDFAVEERFAPCSRFETEITLNKFYKGNLEVAQFFVLSGLNFVACRAKKVGDKQEINAASPLCIREGETLCLFVPEVMPRVIGSAKVVKALG